MNLFGDLLIGGGRQRGQGAGFQGVMAVTGEVIEKPLFASAQQSDVDAACTLAAQAFDSYRGLAAEARAAFLEDAAARIDALGSELTDRAEAETGLPRARLEGERGRTVGQLRMFAALVRSGSAGDPRIELPREQPPRPDIRFLRMGVGPVAVFGASNFPLAFSVAGGDTASALAAGCPVVVKAHPAHPGTSELVGQALQAAVAAAGLHPGVFSLLFDAGREVGSALVSHPAIAAVGFTGSRQGGLALMALAAKRPVPIPVYAEMSSVNPVLLMPAALAARGEEIARNFVASLALGTGQFCTNPGLVLALRGPDLERFMQAASVAVTDVAPGAMLTSGIASAFQSGVEKLATHASVSVAARSSSGRTPAALLRSSAGEVLVDEALTAEVFGPAGLVVECEDIDQLEQVLAALEGQLTATLQIDAGDHDAVRSLLPLLERKVGRILVNGFPTGVEVCDSMVHGGPFPATSDGRSTSVGTAAIDRYLRPVCFQNFPDALLPPELQRANPLGLLRRVASESTRAPA